MSDQKIALVTGASRGIGAAIATRLANDGYRVVGTATGEKGLEAITAALGDSGTALQLDLSNDESIESLFAALDEKDLAPSILVNNAGITRDNLLLRMKEDEWSSVIDANLSGNFKMCKRVVRAMMKARFGRIVNITSVVGATGNAGQANYAAAKAGVIGFTKSLARELAARSITVNAVAPGFIETDMTAVLDEKQRESILASVPAGRLGSAQEVASVVAFLVSDQAAYVTGETIHVNGGMYMG